MVHIVHEARKASLRNALGTQCSRDAVGEHFFGPNSELDAFGLPVFLRMSEINLEPFLKKEVEVGIFLNVVILKCVAVFQ